jgi:flavorubredoxin
LRGLKYQLPLPALSFRFRPTADDMAACRKFGGDFVAALNEKA